MGQLKCTVAFVALVFCLGCDREVPRGAVPRRARRPHHRVPDTTVADTSTPTPKRPRHQCSRHERPRHQCSRHGRPRHQCSRHERPHVKDGTVTVTVKLDPSCFKTPTKVESQQRVHQERRHVEAPKAMIFSNKVAQTS